MRVKEMSFRSFSARGRVERSAEGKALNFPYDENYFVWIIFFVALSVAVSSL